MALKLKTAPATFPITLAEAKAHLRVTTEDEDTYISALIAAATSHLDGTAGILGRCLVSQVWYLLYDTFPTGDLMIPLGPVLSIDKVEYVDPDTLDYVTWSSSNYDVDLVSTDAWVLPVNGWPTIADTALAVRVTFTAGYETIPQAIKQAMLLLIGHWYENREASVVGLMASPLPMAVDALLGPFRRVGF